MSERPPCLSDMARSGSRLAQTVKPSGPCVDMPLKTRCWEPIAWLGRRLKHARVRRGDLFHKTTADANARPSPTCAMQELVLNSQPCWGRERDVFLAPNKTAACAFAECGTRGHAGLYRLPAKLRSFVRKVEVDDGAGERLRGR